MRVRVEIVVDAALHVDPLLEDVREIVGSELKRKGYIVKSVRGAVLPLTKTSNSGSGSPEHMPVPGLANYRPEVEARK